MFAISPFCSVDNNNNMDNQVFCRELVSNAADALEKRRHFQLTHSSSQSEEASLEILLTVDKEQKQFIIQDSGIGMTEEEMVDLLGTIAKSGTSF